MTLFVTPSKNGLLNAFIHPSTAMLKPASIRPIAGAIQKSAAGGVLSPMLCLLSLRRRSCVRQLLYGAYW